MQSQTKVHALLFLKRRTSKILVKRLVFEVLIAVRTILKLLAIAPFLFALSLQLQSVPDNREHMGGLRCFACAFRAQDTFDDYLSIHDTRLHHYINL